MPRFIIYWQTQYNVHIVCLRCCFPVPQTCTAGYSWELHFAGQKQYHIPKVQLSQVSILYLKVRESPGVDAQALISAGYANILFYCVPWYQTSVFLPSPEETYCNMLTPHTWRPVNSIVQQTLTAPYSASNTLFQRLERTSKTWLWRWDPWLNKTTILPSTQLYLLSPLTFSCQVFYKWLQCWFFYTYTQ